MSIELDIDKVTELSMSCVQWKSLAEALEAVGEFISKFGLNVFFNGIHLQECPIKRPKNSQDRQSPKEPMLSFQRYSKRHNPFPSSSLDEHLSET